MKIGFIDSGIGSIITAEYFNSIIPCVQTVCFSDSLFFPYEKLHQDVILKRLHVALGIMKKHGCDKVILSCNTISVLISDSLLFDNEKKYEIKIFRFTDFITAQLTFLSLAKKTIGIIGTKHTVESNFYQNFLKKICNQIKIISVSATGLPLLAENFYKCSGTLIDNAILNKYLCEFKINNIDILILGCTHYTVLKTKMMDYFSYFNKKVQLIDGLDGTILKKKLEIYKTKNLNQSKNEILIISSKLDETFIRCVKNRFGREVSLIEDNTVS